MQIPGAAAMRLADIAVVAVAADPDGAAASAPVPTIAAASAVNASILNLFIVSLLLREPPHEALDRKDSATAHVFPRRLQLG
jgi:hypothetical protein